MVLLFKSFSKCKLFFFFVQTKQSTWFCLTGDGLGEVLADERLFSISSGKSTDPVFNERLA